MKNQKCYPKNSSQSPGKISILTERRLKWYSMDFHQVLKEIWNIWLNFSNSSILCLMFIYLNVESLLLSFINVAMWVWSWVLSWVLSCLVAFEHFQVLLKMFRGHVLGIFDPQNLNIGNFWPSPAGASCVDLPCRLGHSLFDKFSNLFLQAKPQALFTIRSSNMVENLF